MLSTKIKNDKHKFDHLENRKKTLIISIDLYFA